VRLRRSDCSGPGIRRQVRGRGFSYANADGSPITEEDGARIAELVIPPAWTDVWICPWSNGHIQATGTDAAGRRQYRYHDVWRIHRDREKFERVVEFARLLPGLRRKVDRDLSGPDLDRARVLAAIVRLLDVGLFRIGGEEYAEEHETFGVASLRKEHVHIRDGAMVFDYPAKGSIQRKVEVRDEPVAAVVDSLRRRRSGDNLFAYKNGKRWCDVHAADVNEYIKELAGDRYSAKDFRTWSATMLAAVALAAAGPMPDSKTRRKRLVAGAVKEVAAQLGNTPTVCRSSYIDPRVIDRYDAGETIADLVRRLPDLEQLAEGGAARRRQVEQAVIALIEADS
jgi:DNA topoisomerase IB